MHQMITRNITAMPRKICSQNAYAEFFWGGGGSMMVELFKGGGAQYELPHANCKSP